MRSDLAAPYTNGTEVQPAQCSATPRGITGSHILPGDLTLAPLTLHEDRGALGSTGSHSYPAVGLLQAFFDSCPRSLEDEAGGTRSTDG